MDEDISALSITREVSLLICDLMMPSHGLVCKQLEMLELRFKHGPFHKPRLSTYWTSARTEEGHRIVLERPNFRTSIAKSRRQTPRRELVLPA